MSGGAGTSCIIISTAIAPNSWVVAYRPIRDAVNEMWLALPWLDYCDPSLFSLCIWLNCHQRETHTHLMMKNVPESSDVQLRRRRTRQVPPQA